MASNAQGFNWPQCPSQKSLFGRGHLWRPFINYLPTCAVQSDLGYPAISGPAHIRISDLAGYERYAYQTASSVGLNTSYNVFTHCYSICNKLSFI